MPDMFGSIQQQFNEFWQGMDNKQKTKLLSIVVLSILIVGIGIYLLSRPTYVTLFNKLEASDMVTATQKLNDLKIPYKMSDDGYSLLVAANQRGLAQVQLSNAGIPKHNTSYADALSSKSTLGQTESDKTRQYVEYKSSEIASVLVNNSNSISAAEVFLNIPQSDGFFGGTKKSTASVKITPNGELTSAQIDGIARFVANSVEGLDPKDVEIVDNNMKILKDYDGSADGGASTQYNLERQINKNKEKEIADLLATQTADYDDVKVVPNLKLDFNSETSAANTLEPVINGQGAIISQSQNIENLQNGTAQGGVPGTDSNSGTNTQTSVTTGNGGTYSKTNATTNYKWNEKTTQQIKALGQIDKNNSTISVILRYGKNVQQPPSQAVIDTVINQVSGATGLSADRIMVNSQKMAKDTVQKSGINYSYVLQQYGSLGIAAILIALLAFAVFAGPKKFKVGKLAGDIDFGINMNSRNERTIEEIELEEKSEVKKQIDKFVKQKPETVASLLRNWLAEDWE